MATYTTVQILPASALRKVIWKTGGGPQRDIEARAKRVARYAKMYAPAKTGRLRRSITVQQARTDIGRYDIGYEVGASAPYSIYVHEGTAPHRIQGSPLLGFYWPKVGRRIALPYVNHPGTTAQPFLTRALPQAVR